MITERSRGFLFAAGAYGLWGMLPVYWKLLAGIAAWQLVAHRLLWSALLLGLLLLVKGRGKDLVAALCQPRNLRIYGTSAVLITVNWLTYVWAVNSGQIIESSLGYFINPLISVSLGVIVLGERMRLVQWLAVLLAAGGLLILTLQVGRLPWIAIVLAMAFGLYGLVKKRAPLPSLDGLLLEFLLLAPLALVGLFWARAAGQGALFNHGWGSDLLLVGTGLITATPLLLFAAGAKRIPLFWVGMLQYLAPTGQFLIGVLVYHEAFGRDQLPGYLLVWIALLLLAAEGAFVARRSRTVQVDNPLVQRTTKPYPVGCNPAGRRNEDTL